MKRLIFVMVLLTAYGGVVLYANRNVGHRDLLAMSGSGTADLGEIELDMKWDWWPLTLVGNSVRIIARGDVTVIRSTYSGHAERLRAHEEYEMNGDLAIMRVGKSNYYIPHASEFTAIIVDRTSHTRRDNECLRLK